MRLGLRTDVAALRLMVCAELRRDVLKFDVEHCLSSTAHDLNAIDKAGGLVQGGEAK